MRSQAAVIVVAVVALVGVGYLTFISATERIFVAAVGLAACHQITQADITCGRLARGDRVDVVLPPDERGTCTQFTRCVLHG